MRRLFRTATLTWLTAAAVAVSTGCEIQAGEAGLSISGWSGRASDTWTRSYTVSPGGRLEIVNVNGEVQAVASTGSTVEVIVERSASAASDESARELLSKVEMREEVDPGRVRIETNGPRTWRGGYGAKFLVRVPPGIHVDLRTVNGGVRVHDLSGEVRAVSTNGGVRGRVREASVLEARTTNGGVELEVADTVAADARVELASVNGGVRLSIPGDTRADVSARCVNGRVRVDEALAIDAEGKASRRHVEGRLNGGGARIDLRTTNGGVALGRS